MIPSGANGNCDTDNQQQRSLHDRNVRTATVNLYDDDTPATVVTVAAADATAKELGINKGIFTIARAGSTASALTVNYTMSGTATSGSDYTALPAV